MFQSNRKVKLTVPVADFVKQAYHGLYIIKENFDEFGMATVDRFENGYLFLKGKGTDCAILSPSVTHLVVQCNTFANISNEYRS